MRQNQPYDLDLGTLRDAFAAEDERRMRALYRPRQKEAVAMQTIGVKSGDVAFPRKSDQLSLLLVVRDQPR